MKRFNKRKKNRVEKPVKKLTEQPGNGLTILEKVGIANLIIQIVKMIFDCLTK
jgi:hypothetical protein